MMTNNSDPRVVMAGKKIAAYAEKIEKLFNSTDSKVTIIVRPSNNPEEELVVTSDNIDEAIKSLERSKKRDANINILKGEI